MPATLYHDVVARAVYMALVIARELLRHVDGLTTLRSLDALGTSIETIAACCSDRDSLVGKPP